MSQKYLTTPQAAAYCNISRQGIYLAIRKGRIKGFLQGGRWLTTEEELDRYKLSKYTREFLSYCPGELVFDAHKGTLSCPQVAKIFSDALGRPYPLHKVYNRIYTNKLKAHKVNYTWVVHSKDAHEFLQQEILARMSRDVG